MRLIDADELKELYEDYEGLKVPCEVVLQNIDDMPTAYDVDENVGYLRATPEANDYIKAIRDAIKIVRAGMKELKPCPFCGGEPLLEPYEVRKGYEASIQCNRCLGRMISITYDDEKTAVKKVIEAWNRRAGE